MGIFFSKKETIDPGVPDNTIDNIVFNKQTEGILEDYASEFLKWEEKQKTINDEALKKMKDEFIKRPDIFLSNLLILSVQFYENFERDRVTIVKRVRDKEIEYNDTLIQYKRRIQFLGSHEEVAAWHTLYNPEDSKDLEVPGYKQYYVIQDNVHLYPESEYENIQDSEYSDVDGPPYRFSVEDSNRHTGYVRLRCIDMYDGQSRKHTYEDIYATQRVLDEDAFDPMINPRPAGGRRLSGVLPSGFMSTLKDDIADVKEEIQSFKSKKTKKGLEGIPKPARVPKERRGMEANLNDPKFNELKAKLSHMNSSDEDSDGDDDSRSILEDIAEEEKTTRDTIDFPSTIEKQCFVDKKLKVNDVRDAYNLHKFEKSDRRTYLSSERYLMKWEDYFEEFLKTIKKSELIHDAIFEKPASVVTDRREMKIVKSEYIPAFTYSEWPRCALEWKLRERNVKTDHITQAKYSWPRPRTVDEIIHSHGCTVVPIGFHNPREPNNIKIIEWQLQFVRAEQILLRSLGHQQIKVLLMIQFLFRDHIFTSEFRPLKPQHFRYILFWICEENYKDWQDDRLAVRIKCYLKTLRNALATRNLPHYFIRRVNILDTIRDKDMRIVQEAVQRIDENLPMFLMKTVYRMRTHTGFYPRMEDTKKIYNLVKVKKYGIELISPGLTAGNDETDEDDVGDRSSSESEDQETKELKIKLIKERERRHSLFLEKSGRSDEKPKNQTVIKKDFDLTIKVKKLNDLRAEKLLIMFARHFNAIAKTSNHFKDHPQAAKYLNYSRNLLAILRDPQLDCPGVYESNLEDVEKEIDYEWDVMRQGLNYMLNNTHRLTETMDLKLATPTPRSEQYKPVYKQAPTPGWQYRMKTDEETEVITPSSSSPITLTPGESVADSMNFQTPITVDEKKESSSTFEVSLNKQSKISEKSKRKSFKGKSSETYKKTDEFTNDYSFVVSENSQQEKSTADDHNSKKTQKVKATKEIVKKDVKVKGKSKSETKKHEGLSEGEKKEELKKISEDEEINGVTATKSELGNGTKSSEVNIAGKSKHSDTKIKSSNDKPKSVKTTAEIKSSVETSESKSTESVVSKNATPLKTENRRIDENEIKTDAKSKNSSSKKSTDKVAGKSGKKSKSKSNSTDVKGAEVKTSDDAKKDGLNEAKEKNKSSKITATIEALPSGNSDSETNSNKDKMKLENKIEENHVPKPKLDDKNDPKDTKSSTTKPSEKIEIKSNEKKTSSYPNSGDKNEAKSTENKTPNEPKSGDTIDSKSIENKTKKEPKSGDTNEPPKKKTPKEPKSGDKTEPTGKKTPKEPKSGDKTEPTGKKTPKEPKSDDKTEPTGKKTPKEPKSDDKTEPTGKKTPKEPKSDGKTEPTGKKTPKEPKSDDKTEPTGKKTPKEPKSGDKTDSTGKKTPKEPKSGDKTDSTGKKTPKEPKSSDKKENKSSETSDTKPSSTTNSKNSKVSDSKLEKTHVTKSDQNEKPKESRISDSYEAKLMGMMAKKPKQDSKSSEKPSDKIETKSGVNKKSTKSGDENATRKKESKSTGKKSSKDIKSGAKIETEKKVTKSKDKTEVKDSVSDSNKTKDNKVLLEVSNWKDRKMTNGY